MRRLLLLAPLFAVLLLAGWRRPYGTSGTQFYLDMTQPTVTGLVSTRTGGTMYPARGAGTTVVAVTGADVYESRADGDGHWAFDGYTNSAPPFDFVTGWTTSGSPTVTANFGTAPDGTSTSTKLADASTSLTAMIKYLGATGTKDAVATVWVKDSSPTPTATGAIFARTGPMPSPGWGRDLLNIFGGASWRRVVGAYTLTGTNIDPEIVLYPAGATPVRGSSPTLDATATGAVEVWGASAINGSNDLPLVNGSTSALVQSVDPSLLGSILNANGDLDIEVAFISNYLEGANAGEQDGTVWSMQTPLGQFHVDAVGGSFKFMLDATQLAIVTPAPNGGNPDLGGEEIKIRTWYLPSQNKLGIKVTKGGCYEAPSNVSSTLSAIGTPTNFYIGSKAGAAGTFYARRYSLARRDNLSLANLGDAEGVIIGDSTSAAYSGNVMTVGENIYTLAESRSRPGIASLAVTSQTTAQQLTVWQASAQRGKASTKWVYVMIGINDIISGGADAATLTASIQGLVNDINTSTPGAKILLAPMIPVTMFTTGQRSVWTAVNANIEGTGGTPITGSNLIRVPLWSALDDGSGNLLSQYAYGDNLHENDAARELIGETIRSILQANGLL